MKMKWIILPLMMLLLVASVAAECIPKISFIGKLQDECVNPGNGICENAEYPLSDSDCELTIDALSCNGDRCIFEEIWFAKAVIIMMAFMLVFFKKDYLLYIAIGMAILIGFNGIDIFGDTGSFPDNSPEVIISQEIKANNTLYQYGYKINNTLYDYGYTVMPSNPRMGIAIMVILAFLLLRYILKNLNRGY